MNSLSGVVQEEVPVVKDYKGNAHKCLMAKAVVEDGEDQHSPDKLKVTPRSNPPLSRPWWCADIALLPGPHPGPRLLGNVARNFKKIPMITQDLSRRCIAMRGGEFVHVPS